MHAHVLPNQAITSGQASKPAKATGEGLYGWSDLLMCVLRFCLPSAPASKPGSGTGGAGGVTRLNNFGGECVRPDVKPTLYHD